MADRSFGQGYLGELGTRLQRLLGFDGEAGASFTAQAVPVLLVGNGTEPGYGQNSGRRFAIPGPEFVLAGNNHFWFRAVDDLIIEKIIAVKANTDAALGYVTCGLLMATSANPGAANASLGVFLDRPASITDRPAIISGVYGPAGAAGDVILNSLALPAAFGMYGMLHDYPFRLAAGQGMIFQGFAAISAVTIFGKTP